MEWVVRQKRKYGLLRECQKEIWILAGYTHLPSTILISSSVKPKKLVDQGVYLALRSDYPVYSSSLALVKVLIRPWKKGEFLSQNW
jgi:hypothetical protein